MHLHRVQACASAHRHTPSPTLKHTHRVTAQLLRQGLSLLHHFYQGHIMNTRTRLSFAVIFLTVILAACGSMSKQDQNTATGAVIGGVAGAVLTGGSTAGTVGGAAVGGIIGNKVDPDKK
jgi:osmotically inducible lipoprotein OsmB